MPSSRCVIIYLKSEYNIIGHSVGDRVVLINVWVIWEAFSFASNVRPWIAVIVQTLWRQYHIGCGWRWSCKRNKTWTSNKDNVIFSAFRLYRVNNDLPTSPPIRKHASWQKSNDNTSTNNFFPLKFSSMTPPAILLFIDINYE
jgi:hypothetical protein